MGCFWRLILRLLIWSARKVLRILTVRNFVDLDTDDLAPKDKRERWWWQHEMHTGNKFCCHSVNLIMQKKWHTPVKLNFPQDSVQISKYTSNFGQTSPKWLQLYAKICFPYSEFHCKHNCNQPVAFSGNLYIKKKIVRVEFQIISKV